MGFSKPKKVTIQGHVYQIVSDFSKECQEELAESAENPTGLRGCIQYQKQKIYIDPELTRDGWYATLIHELIHGFLHHMHMLDNNEGTVDNLTTAFFTFLSENKLWTKKN